MRVPLATERDAVRRTENEGRQLRRDLLLRPRWKAHDLVRCELPHDGFPPDRDGASRDTPL